MGWKPRRPYLTFVARDSPFSLTISPSTFDGMFSNEGADTPYRWRPRTDSDTRDRKG